MSTNIRTTLEREKKDLEKEIQHDYMKHGLSWFLRGVLIGAILTTIPYQYLLWQIQSRQAEQLQKDIDQLKKDVEREQIRLDKQKEQPK